jgi:hypothetical protein
VAVLIPEIFGRKLGSAAEKKLAQRFGQELDDSAVLLHSVGLIRHSEKRWAEADFVLICRQGVFCLEVKGGRVARTEGVWTFTDRFGHTDDKYEGPFDQAGGAAGSLQSWLTRSDVRRDDGSAFQVGYGVMMPDCVLDVVGPDIEQELLCDQRHDAAQLGDFVDRIGSYWRERMGATPLSVGEIDRLRAAIRPDFEATMTRSLVVGLIEDQLVRFTEEQSSVLDALADNPRMVVRGAAGTGKSLLAIREARRLAKDGRRVLLACHTGALAVSLASSVAADDSIDVFTVGALMHGLVQRAGLLGELPDATEDVIFDVFMPELAVRALSDGSTGGEYDALVVDEGQDLLRGDAPQVLDLMFEGGFERGVWRLFQDPNQSIFGRPQPQSLELLGRGAPTRFKLTRNCRNTREIVEISLLLSGASVAAESATSGPEVSMSTDWAEPWEARSVAFVESVIEEGTAPEDLAVLVMTRDQRDGLVASFPRLLSARRERGHVQCSTIAGFKGLEATGIVLAGLWSLDEPHFRQAAYVGTTRARVLLAIALAKDARSSLERRVADYASVAASRATGASDESAER